MVIEAKVEEVKYWARRVECPVDEDAGYRNTFVCCLHNIALARHANIGYSGAIVTSFRSRQPDKHGHGKATQATGLSLASTRPRGLLGLRYWLSA